LLLNDIRRVQHLIDQGRFAVIDVRNNCYISDILHNRLCIALFRQIKFGHKGTIFFSYMQARADFFLFCKVEFVKSS